jgi:hypothetical protein
VVEDDDWRLMAQDGYLLDRAMRLTPWFALRPDWDHDHCSFCSAKIWDRASGEDEFDSGYVTADDQYHWVCEACFDDLCDRFRWTVEEST